MKNGLVCPTLAAVLIAVWGAVLSAQDKGRPDFSGSWRRIDLQSTALPGGGAVAGGGGGRWVARGSAAEGGPPPAAVANVAPQLTLQLTDTALIVKVPGRPDAVYTLDNKDKKSEIMTRGGKVEITMKSQWDGARIVTTETQKAMVEGELRQAESKLTRSLDKDGRLTIAFDSSTGQGNYKAVYVKDTATP